MPSYDSVPYTDHAFAEAHPDRLAVVAALAGWTAAPIATARVLDVGCARGGHVLPMAAALPGASFVGVDAAAAQIDEASAIARACGVTNARFVAARFEDAAAPDGAFDYVIAHGVWSWVAKDARRALLARIARWLAPGGVAYVSFNALPGWYAKLGARDWMRLAAARGDDPRAALEWLRKQRADATLDAIAARLDATDPAYLVHEYLSDEHHPEHVATFLDEARAAGLAYLGDAIAQETALESLDDAARARASLLDAAGAQQLVDFVRDAAFRRALLVRADDADARGWRWPHLLDARALGSLRVAVREPVNAIGLAPSTQRALDAALAAAPRSIAIAPRDAPELFDLWLAGAIDLHAHEPAFASEPSDAPRANAVARWHAEHGGPITNARHHEVRLAEPILRAVLARCDGARSIDAIARDLDAPSDLVRGCVALLARSALLVA